MALKSNFNESQSMKDVERQAESLNEKILNSFIMALEEFIANARGQLQDHAMGQYKDQTTNLRNSIGGFILYNGEMVYEKQFGNAIANKQAIQDVIKPTGFQLIGIAGMNYASFVESKGYNVISYQADVCMINLAGYFEKLEVISQGSAAQMEETFIP